MMLETVREYARSASTRTVRPRKCIVRTRCITWSWLSTQPEVSSNSTGWLVLERSTTTCGRRSDGRSGTGEVDIGTRLALALWRFWPERYHITEGRRWLEAVLALGQPEGGVAEPTLSARRWAFLHLVTGMLASGRGDHERAVDLYEQSLTLYRTMGHRKGQRSAA